MKHNSEKKQQKFCFSGNKEHHVGLIMVIDSKTEIMASDVILQLLAKKHK